MKRTEELIGTVLGEKYRIDRLVGRGGMGAVYAGTHIALDRPVAIKVLKPEFIADAAALARFSREARTAARVEHPNVVGVYDFGSLDGGAYLVMEYVEGRSLRELMREHGRLPLDAAFHLIQQAAAAVAEAHAKGVIHRDLKPENMIVRADGDGSLTLKVVDFGIAKLLASSEATQVTGPAELVGTPKYMAPEQFSGEPIDERIDVYALGIIFYELLAGRAPFEGSVAEVIGKHLYSTPAPLKDAGVDVPEAVELAIAHTLEKRPGDRTPSAAAFVLELGEACGDAITWSRLPLATAALSRSIPTEHAESTSSSQTTTIGSLLPPSGIVSRKAAEEFITRYLSRNDSEEIPTRIRAVDIPTVVIPEAVSRLLPGGATKPLARAKETLLQIATPATARKRWLAPAAIGLAALLIFGTGGGPEPDATAAQPSVVAAAASVPSVQPVPVAPAPEPAPGEETDAKPDDSGTPNEARARKRSSGRSNRRAPARRSADRNDGAVERVFRIDRHLRRLF